MLWFSLHPCRIPCKITQLQLSRFRNHANAAGPTKSVTACPPTSPPCTPADQPAQPASRPPHLTLPHPNPHIGHALFATTLHDRTRSSSNVASCFAGLSPGLACIGTSFLVPPGTVVASGYRNVFTRAVAIGGERAVCNRVTLHVRAGRSWIMMAFPAGLHRTHNFGCIHRFGHRTRSRGRSSNSYQARAGKEPEEPTATATAKAAASAAAASAHSCNLCSCGDAA